MRARHLVTYAAALTAVLVAACSSPAPSRETGGTPSTTATAARDPRVGRRVHITGCENGELKARLVNLWNTANRSAVVGKLSGDGQESQGFGCQGTVVIIREVIGTMYQVESVAGDQTGWVSEQFIGRTFDTAMCESVFGYSPGAARKCAS